MKKYTTVAQPTKNQRIKKLQEELKAELKKDYVDKNKVREYRIKIKKEISFDIKE